MGNNLSADQPIDQQVRDKFNRYPFAERIAKAVIERKQEDAIVIGLYGAWGEGKTSVLNFIDNILRSEATITVVNFNPWRYSDEDSMLKLFFSEIAKSLSKSIKSDREKIGEFIGKWSGVLNISGAGILNIGNAATSISKILSDVEIEELKNRLSDIIVESGQRVVILIDDIDRLEKTEIQTLFRLVKLTANFKNSTYILSFDDKIVASAIDDRFGSIKENSGSRFLEKIIQLPINLPRIPQQDMYDYATSILNDTFLLHEIEFSESEHQRFIEGLNTAIIPRLKTPRLVIRYNNTISFFIPLLSGEVNIVDLVLIEGIKITYPEYYEFIKNNSNLFIESYFHEYIQRKNEEKVSNFKSELEYRKGDLTNKEFDGLTNLLRSLFPVLHQVFGYNASPNEHSLAKEKRIASEKYFERYFSYSILKGQISDVVFNNFISTASSKDEHVLLSSIKTFIAESSDLKFIHKLRDKEADINWNTASIISKIFLNNSSLFSKSGNTIFTLGIGSSYWQMIAFVIVSLKKTENPIETFSFLESQFNIVKPLTTLWDLFSHLLINKETKKLLNDDQIKSLINILIDRLRTIEVEFPFIDNNKINIRDLVQIWLTIDKEYVKQYFNDILSSDSEKWFSFLNIFISDCNDSTYLGTYKGDINEEIYEFIVLYFDIELIKSNILIEFTEDQVMDNDIIWNNLDGPYQSRLNTARQLFYWNNPKR